MLRFLFSRFKSATCEWLPDASKGMTVYVGMPLKSPRIWMKAASYNRHTLYLEDNTPVSAKEVHSYLVVYPNKEVLNGVNLFAPLPAGITFLEPAAGSKESLMLDSAEMKFGRIVIQVQHKNFRRDAEGKMIYSTKIKNISQGRIRITCFAGFRPAGNKYVLNTVTGKFFSADQFIAWYDAPKDGWIAAGQEVADDNNYGGGSGLWAFFGETETRETFIGVAELPG
ncbi:hypothetical protein Cflav_PD1649 [Pedosphaera parvula Ellin514]|uniref:Uncharacterized protein n=2 Tax=Pedosphaera TaxID=1032526 RepID=B9XM29_PEDPL|nr:hypothetical protein Cflav_PD1649 [Pedosphaera parvula Ellin514]